MIGALVLVGIVGSAIGIGASPKTPSTVATSDTSTTSPAQASTSQPAPSPVATNNVGTPQNFGTPPKPPTKNEEEALGAARDYLSFQGFSRNGLIQQLDSKAGDGYRKADAVWAVDHVHANWNDQAVRAAKSYLSFTHFSRAGLIEQLSSSSGDGFTHAQAAYAATKVGLK